MTTGVWVLIGLLVICVVFFVVAVRELERKHQMWEQYYHPPDSVLEEDEDDE